MPLDKLLLTEIEVAHALGYVRWRGFSAALRAGRVPGPHMELPDGSRWSAARLAAWIKGEDDKRGLAAEEREALARVNGGRPKAVRKRSGVG